MSRSIGTPAETAVVKFLRSNGWPYAERRALTGAIDKGDITGTPSICWEVKAGQAAMNASDGQVRSWLKETETERQNASAAIGVLVMKRRNISGTRAGEWWAVVDGGVFADLVYEPQDGQTPYEQLGIPVRTNLQYLVELLRGAGYGEPL